MSRPPDLLTLQVSVGFQGLTSNSLVCFDGSWLPSESAAHTGLVR